MIRSHLVRVAALAVGVACIAAPARLGAQAHVHDPARGSPAPDRARLGGQAAFAAIAEVVRLLEADARTDWAKVDLERLRAHLVDMDRVTLRAAVTRDDVPGGARFTVRGDTGTLAAAARMARAHAPILVSERGWDTRVEEEAGTVRVTVTTRADDSTAATRIRALGLVGLLATGDHHAAHHVAIARGDAQAHAHH
jgi:hypothetical protein